METYTFASVSQQFVRKQKQRMKTLIIKFLNAECATALPSPLPSVFIPSLWLLHIKLWGPNSCCSSPHSFLPVITTFFHSDLVLCSFACDQKHVSNSWSILLSHPCFCIWPFPDLIHSPSIFLSLCPFLQESLVSCILSLACTQKMQKPWG